MTSWLLHLIGVDPADLQIGVLTHQAGIMSHLVEIRSHEVELRFHEAQLLSHGVSLRHFSLETVRMTAAGETAPDGVGWYCLVCVTSGRRRSAGPGIAPNSSCRWNGGCGTVSNTGRGPS